MIASSPESPSKQVARTSAEVGAATSQRVPGSVHAHQPICSAAVRVFPAPRPASSSQTVHQSPGGRIWWSWAVVSHFALHAKASLCASGNRAYWALTLSSLSSSISGSAILGLPAGFQRSQQGFKQADVHLCLQGVVSVPTQCQLVTVLLGVELSQQLQSGLDL